MKGTADKIFLMIFLATISFGIAVVADTITTEVRFLIPSVISFNIAIPANNTTLTSSGATDQILFNTTSTSLNQINATAAGGKGGVQTAAEAIFRYNNTGNEAINITLVLSSTPTCTGGTIELKAGNESTSYQDSCTSATIPNRTVCVNITDSAQTIVPNLAVSGAANIWLWADFNTCAAGTDVWRNLTHTSLAD